MWSNVWSRKFYHIFTQLSTGVNKGICEVKGEYATFKAVEPFWCSSSQTRRDTNFAIPGYSISAIIPRRGRKSKIFLSVVIYVVKAAFMPLSAIGGNPANAGVTRRCGVSPCPVPDTATALPNQARYQTSLSPGMKLQRKRFRCAHESLHGFKGTA